MNVMEIQEKWTNKQNRDLNASISAWDSVAEEYVFDESVTFAHDTFLQFMASKIKLTKELSVLDVGCGAGAYCVALAPCVKNVLGVDFSPRMIAVAKAYAAEHHLENLDYIQRDWYNCDGNEFIRKFDVVYAHTTPAIADYDSFLKMMQASKKYCFFCKPARRTDLVFDEIKKIVGIPPQNNDDSVAYTFDTIWSMGGNPEVSYQDTVWHSQRPLNEAKIWYKGRIRGICSLSEKKEKEIDKFLDKCAVNGNVNETINTKLVNFFWENC